MTLILGDYPREIKTYVHKKACSRLFMAVCFINSSKLENKQKQISINWRMDK